MKRKLLLLNAALLALTALAAWQLRREWDAARARERQVLGRAIRPVAAPPLAPQPAPRPVTAAEYIEIAQKALPFKDRNPNVIIEAVPPPPPKPMPPLPLFHGVMNLGDGPMAMMSEKAGAQNKDYRTGDQVGEFKLVAIHGQSVELEWEGKRVTRLVEQPVEPERTEAAEKRTIVPEPRQTPVVQRQTGPGADIGRGVRACVPNDSTPAGAVVDGLRKVVTPTPFGDACRWEPVK
ncbi:MAG: hypothetical protein ACE15B_18565 [Bryobacteraceae bacterium]